MGGLNGQRIHEASYTNVNQFEEIRSISLVPSKSLSFVVDQLKGVAKSLEENGHPPCSLLYTDNPQGMYLSSAHCYHDMTDVHQLNRNFMKQSLLPLLKVLSTSHLWSNLPPFVLQNVNTNCTSDPFVMESICSDILERAQQMAQNTQLMVIASCSSAVK
jgi:hypothetical protein